MKISVVIPAYNGEKWVAQCIENVLCQSYKNLEIIVIDDGSTDRTAQIAAGYASVKLIRQENRGQSVARNEGASAATGDYIHFMDVDDLLDRDYYTNMVAALGPDIEGAVNGPDGAIDMVFGGFINEARLDFSLSYPQRLLLMSLEDKMSVTNVPIMGFAWRYLIRRGFIEEHGLRFEPGRLIEDLLFSLEAVARAKRIVTAPGTKYCYMKRSSSSLNSRDKEQMARIKRDYKYARTFRRQFMLSHNLSLKVDAYHKLEYKLLGIPLLYKIDFRNGKSKWYFCGLRILQRKAVMP